MTSPPTKQPLTVEEARTRILCAITDYGSMKPEDDEDWESWYTAAFDMLGERVRGILDAGITSAEGLEVNIELPPAQRYWWSPNRMQPWTSSWSANAGPHPDWNVTAYYSADEVRAILAARKEPQEADRSPLWKQYSDEQTAKEVGRVRKALEGKI